MNASSRESAKKPEISLRAIVASGRLVTLRWPNFTDYRAQVENLYRHSNYATVWIRSGHPTPQALEMISVLQQADGEGLLAEDYDSSAWPGRLARLQAHQTPSDEARFDVALTVCTMRYVSDLRVGRINPRHFEFGRDVSPKKLNLSTFVEKNLAKGMDLKSALASIEPLFQRYKATRQALLKYMELAKQNDGEKLPPPIGVVYRGGVLRQNAGPRQTAPPARRYAAGRYLPRQCNSVRRTFTWCRQALPAKPWTFRQWKPG
jgi:murein L,D-transpeptidase YcbB/YkuD